MGGVAGQAMNSVHDCWLLLEKRAKGRGACTPITKHACTSHKAVPMHSQSGRGYAAGPAGAAGGNAQGRRGRCCNRDPEPYFPHP